MTSVKNQNLVKESSSSSYIHTFDIHLELTHVDDHLQTLLLLLPGWMLLDVSGQRCVLWLRMWLNWSNTECPKLYDKQVPPLTQHLENMVTERANKTPSKKTFSCLSWSCKISELRESQNLAYYSFQLSSVSSIPLYFHLPPVFFFFFFPLEPKLKNIEKYGEQDHS